MASPTAPRRILVVDEDSKLRDSYAGQLGEAGFEVTTSDRGLDAIHLLDSGTFDLILSDLNLPDLDGLALARKARERSDIPVILLSEVNQAGALRQAAATSGIELLTKPLLPGALKRAASRLFRRRAGLVFDNRKGEEIALTSFNASDAKNSFGKVLETALREGATVIRKHDVPRAVLLSWEEFNALAATRRAQLDTLAAEFDGLLARMQTPASRLGMKRAFDASPKDLGRAAVKAARKRG